MDKCTEIDAATATVQRTALDADPTNDTSPDTNDQQNYGWRFWLVIASLCATSLLTAVEGTVTATALPTIARNLDSRELYVWFVNAIFLSR